MLAKLTRILKFKRSLILSGALVLLLVGRLLFRVFRNRQKEHYTIGIFLNDAEFDSEDMGVVKFIIQKKLESINESGSINKLPVKIIYFDDGQDIDKLYRQVQLTSENFNLIAYIGSKGSTRAKKILPSLEKKKILYIGLTAKRLKGYQDSLIISRIGTSIFLFIRSHQQNVLTWSSRFYQQIVFPVILIAFTIVIQI